MPNLSEAITLGNFVGALVDGLVQAGIHNFCVCPGSRSTPLALTLAENPQARVWMHLDERSAAFFGLGLAKIRREPVALVCTSGTAAANFFPAIVEAYYARVPLVVLTADRPHELRDRGAPQTIDQNRLYGSHVKWFVDLPEPSDEPTLCRYVRDIASRAVATARLGPAGPVHLNCPFRDPLIPVFDGDGAWQETPDVRSVVSVAQGTRTVEVESLAALADDLRSLKRGLIVCGPVDDPGLAEPVAELAAALGYPILADPLSGVRCGIHDRSLVLDGYDAFLRLSDFPARHIPDVILRFGAIPTAKVVTQFLQSQTRRQILVDGDAGWNDPTLSATDVFHVDGPLFCRTLRAALGDRTRANTQEPESSSWVATWRTANDLARRAIERYVAEMDELFEGRVFAELAEILPDGAILYAGNSMPVRDLDTFFPASSRRLRFLANRGVNGIDGVVSSALGASASGIEGPLVLVIGDLSFYHDLNGLLAAMRHQLSATIVLLNNDGGGIFSFLPQADHPEHFEALFGTPHGLDFQGAVEMYGGTFQRAITWPDFRAALRTALNARSLNVVEVPTDRARNVALHRAGWRSVATALSRCPDAEGDR